MNALLEGGLPSRYPQRRRHEFATLVRNGEGLASGGIRLPRLAVPKALNTGENQPAGCVLVGTPIPFDAEQLKVRYPSLS